MSQTAVSASAAGAKPANASPSAPAAIEPLQWSDFQRYAHSEWRGWAHRDWAAAFADRDPLALLRSERVKQLRDRPTSKTWRVHLNDRLLTVKHITGAKDEPGRDLMSALKWRFGRSRAVRTLAISCDLSHDGFNVPGVVLAARRKAAGTVEDLLVMHTARGWSLTTRLRRAPDQAACRALMALAAKQIARLHRGGYIHGDLLPANVKVTSDDDGLVFLDNDRTRRAPLLGRTIAQRRNVAQMLFRLLRRHRWSDVHVLVQTYFDEMEIAETARRPVIAAMLARVRRRLAGAPRVFPNRPPIKLQ